MKKVLAVILALVFLSGAAASADVLETPKLVSAPDGVTFYDTVTIQVEPVPNAEKYVLDVQDQFNQIHNEYEFDEPVLVYNDWPSWSSELDMEFSVTAVAEGYDAGEPLTLRYKVKNIDDSARPAPPEVTISYADEVVTNKTKMTITINEGYDAFCVATKSRISFPIPGNSETTIVGEYCGPGKDTVITIQGRANGVWSLPGKEITLSCIAAEALQSPEIKVLTDPIYLNEPVEIEILSADERTERFSVKIVRPMDGKNHIFGFTLAQTFSEDMHIRIESWKKLQDPFEPGEYVLRVVSLSSDYNDGVTEIPVTVLAERPDEEKESAE